MEQNLEVEYKMLLSKEQFYALKAHFPEATFVVQTNTYFDTDNHSLEKQGMALRIREHQGAFTITLKVPQTNGILEYEQPVSDASVTSLQSSTALMKQLHALGIEGPLRISHQMRTERAKVHLEQAELCFDINTYFDCMDYEVEYEQTQPHDGMRVFTEILKAAGIQYVDNSKPKIMRALEAARRG